MPRRANDSTLVYSSEDPAVRPHQPTHTPGRGERRGHTTAVAEATKVDGIVRIWLERKGRHGKPVSIIRGLALDGASLATLASRLKRLCGTGGSAKEGEIIIQGDHRTRLARELERAGHRVKLAGG